MKAKIVGIITTLIIAFTVLTVSVLKSASVPYAFSPMVLSESKVANKDIKIDYVLAYPGGILPDSPLWYIKALRDKIWYVVTLNPSKKAELNLLFADKRLSMATSLFKQNKPDLGFSTLTKAEKYLIKAIPKDAKDTAYLNKLALASLKHREVIENEILPISSEDLKPEVIKSIDYSKETYKKVRDLLRSIGLNPSPNPFEVE
jgi:predicted acylesterase/phospholipase RssA